GVVNVKLAVKLPVLTGVLNQAVRVSLPMLSSNVRTSLVKGVAPMVTLLTVQLGPGPPKPKMEGLVGALPVTVPANVVVLLTASVLLLMMLALLVNVIGLPARVIGGVLAVPMVGSNVVVIVRALVAVLIVLGLLPTLPNDPGV